MPGGLGSSDQSARIRQLEHLVKEYKAELESHSRDSRDIEEKIAKVLDEAQSQIQSLQSQITSFESTLSELQNANTTLDAEVNDLMRRVASGEYNPKSERVIEFQNNPAAKIMAVRNQVLEDLRKENEALLRSGGGGGGGEGSVPRESWERLCKEKEELEKGHAKRLMRLKEVSVSFVPLDWRYSMVCIPADCWIGIESVTYQSNSFTHIVSPPPFPFITSLTPHPFAQYTLRTSISRSLYRPSTCFACLGAPR
jgi:regulator of replication initiation timing